MSNKRLNVVGDIHFPEGNVNGTMFFEYGFGLRNNPHKGVMTKISPLLHTSTISHYNDYRCIQFSVLLVIACFLSAPKVSADNSIDDRQFQPTPNANSLDCPNVSILASFGFNYL